jgi:hypothetical protein
VIEECRSNEAERRLVLAAPITTMKKYQKGRSGRAHKKIEFFERMRAIG